MDPGRVHHPSGQSNGVFIFLAILLEFGVEAIGAMALIHRLRGCSRFPDLIEEEDKVEEELKTQDIGRYEYLSASLLEDFTR